ncbi:hypothetical protein [Halomonas denitrificans]|uniref:hypothetical protein n=1 Tax=Halomonas denitrificans TaxID=370769 RepID=UPI001C990B2E|nr:hypothetical protein [Halomonas denitrificans]MBY5969583.1 hypothetical protein [Halomonas denitrificans]
MFNDECLKTWSDYFNVPGLRDIYLQVSYVLKIDKGPDHISFFMDFVLMEAHPKYIDYHPGEQYCYKHGVIEFSAVEKINEFYNVSMVPGCLPVDTDIGNIDVFFCKGKRYVLQGDWGELDIECEHVMAYFQDS